MKKGRKMINRKIMNKDLLILRISLVQSEEEENLKQLS